MRFLLLALSLAILSVIELIAASDAMPVSLITLLANPNDFDGKKVQIEGYVHIRFEDSALYLTKEYAERYSGGYAVWLEYKEGFEPYDINNGNEIDLNTLDSKWVLIEGIFRYDGGEQGHLGNFAAEVLDVDRIYELKKLKGPKQKLIR